VLLVETPSLDGGVMSGYAHFLSLIDALLVAE